MDTPPHYYSGQEGEKQIIGGRPSIQEIREEGVITSNSCGVEGGDDEHRKEK